MASVRTSRQPVYQKVKAEVFPEISMQSILKSTLNAIFSAIKYLDVGM